jgi:S-DNA-T family DNA segregation ATPase FtsK/SpoIIIE
VVKTPQLDSTQVIYVPQTAPQFDPGPDPATLLGNDAKNLALPASKSISLAILSGPAKGMVYALTKPWVVLGRTAGDVIINDPNVSRWHCAVEVKGDVVRVRDLDSTNGTFVGAERIGASDLHHLSEFRVGESVVLLTITSKLASPR